MARRRRGKGAAKPGRQWGRFILATCLVVLLVGLIGAGTAAIWAYTMLSRTLPSVAALERFDPSEGSKVYDDNDELITEFHVERRIFVPLAQMPKPLREAIIATEDARFYSHYGVDPMGIARAIYQNFRRGRIVEGGSTITQQLAKVLLLTPDKSLERKFRKRFLRWNSSGATRRTAFSSCTSTRSTSDTARSGWKRPQERFLAKEWAS